MRILVVDHNERYAAVLRRALADRGHGCGYVTSIDAAIEAATMNTFDVVVADVRVGSQSGLILMRALRMLSASTTRVLMSDAIDADDIDASVCDAFLQKPFTLEELFRVVEGGSRGDLPG